MSNTSCHLGRWCTPSGRWQAARRAAIAGSSQRSGRNSRQSSGQLACSVTALTDTPSWQLAVLPSVPEYCRCTPTEQLPSLGKPVSSWSCPGPADTLGLARSGSRVAAGVPPLVVGGAEVAQGGVPPAGVVEALQVIEDRRAGLGAGGEPGPVQQLAFQGGEEALGDRVVIAVADRAHGGDQAGLA